MGTRKKISENSTDPEKAKRGRPATGRVRDRRIPVRCTEDELAAIQSAAAKARTTPGKWLLARGLNDAGYRAVDISLKQE